MILWRVAGAEGGVFMRPAAHDLLDGMFEFSKNVGLQQLLHPHQLLDSKKVIRAKPLSQDAMPMDFNT